MDKNKSAEEILRSYETFKEQTDELDETHIYLDNAILAMEEYKNQELTTLQQAKIMGDRRLVELEHEKTVLQQANAELQKEVDKWRDSANYYKDTYPVIVAELEKQKAELADALDNLTRVVGKHHKNIAIPEQEDLYMAYHNALNVLKSNESNKQP